MIKDAVELAGNIYLPALLFVVCGFLFLLLTKEKSTSEKTTEQKDGSQEKISETNGLEKGSSEGKWPVIQLTRGERKKAVIVGLALIGIGLLFAVISWIVSNTSILKANQAPTAVLNANAVPSTVATAYPTYTAFPTYTPYPIQTQDIAVTPTALPSVSILSLSYRSSGWKPKIIDFRKADESGLPIYRNTGLRLFDLWVDVSRNCVNCTGIGEAYADGKFIGATETLDFKQGKNVFPWIYPRNYISGADSKEWTVQESWRKIDVIVILYSNDQKVSDTKISFLINPDTETGWFIGPPFANVAEISYRVNGGEEKWIDWRTAGTEGITLNIDDELQLDTIWYKANVVADKNALEFGAQLQTEDSMIEGTYRNSTSQIIGNGIHPFPLSNFKPWKITQETKSLYVFLSRNEDGVVLEEILIPITIGNQE